MNNKRIKLGVIAGAAALALGLTLALSGAANAANPPSDGGVQPDGTIIVCVSNNTVDLHDWVAPNNGTHGCPASYTKVQFNIAGVKGDTGATGAAGATGAQGPAGPAGPAGTSAILTANASTAVSNRTDSGGHGDWATDAFTRTASITRHSAVAKSNCGGTATACWFYSGTITDSGSFLTITGANSPQAGTVIAGTHVSGTFTGGSSFEFYASSDTPNASLVPATLTGNGQSTSTWMRQFFAPGTQFAGEDEPSFSWTYAAGATCEQWVDASTNSDGSLPADGDIAGVNHC